VEEEARREQEQEPRNGNWNPISNKKKSNQEIKIIKSN